MAVWRVYAKWLLWLWASLGLYAQDERYAAAFLEIPLGARALGMGTAFTAIADDAWGFYWNPAGVGLLPSTVLLSGMYSSQYGSLGSPLAHFFHVGLTLPVSGLQVALNWERFTVPDLRRYPDLTRVLSPQEREELVRRAGQGEFIPNANDAFWLTLARLFVVPIDFGWMRFAVPVEFPVGVNFKLVRESIAEHSASGIGVDAGTIVRINLKDITFDEHWPRLTLGMCVRDVAGTRILWTTQRPHRIPTSAQWGVSLTQPLEMWRLEATVAYDYDGRYTAPHRYGAELLYRRSFALRFGLRHGVLTLGAGVDAGFLTADYGFLADSDEHLGNVHRFALTLRLERIMERLR
ncbi:MAG: hypothetical protein NZ473_06085 [Candidatus Kapabacteria bacterium]|nr:hypothetical protein [Candidatus Kapabacteria bacterium]MDW8225882.1 hypothetical protein [Bacteroidota bacterium]